MDKSVGFIGGGRVTKIILNGLKRAGKMPANIIVSDPSTDVLEILKNDFPEIITVLDNNQKAAAQDIIFIAVHPPVMVEILKEIKPSLKLSSFIVSLAPKLKIEEISQSLDGFQNVVRMIPNAPSIINNGYNPISFSPKINNIIKKELLDYFSVLGNCPEVDENNLEAYAILTAMGPTYFWFQFQQLEELGRSFGLEDRELKEGLFHMISGAVQTFYHSGLTPGEVMDLIPVKPMGDEEKNIKTAYQSRLTSLFQQLKE